MPDAVSDSLNALNQVSKKNSINPQIAGLWGTGSATVAGRYSKRSSQYSLMNVSDTNMSTISALTIVELEIEGNVSITLTLCSV